MKKAVKKIFSLILTAAIIVSLFPALTAQVYAANNLAVSNLNDSGPGSLRDAITNAASGDIISFQGGTNGTIVLSSELIINKDLTIKGPGAANLTISGNNQCRVFQITGGNVFISDLTVANGKAVGNSGGNGGDSHDGGGGGGGGAAGGGGGLLIKGGMAIISNVTFSGNIALGGTGGTGGYAYLTSGDGPGGVGGASDLLDGSKGGEADYIGKGGPFPHDGFRYGGGGGGYGGYSGYTSGSSGGDGGAYIRQSGGLGGHGGAYYLSSGEVKQGVLGGNGGYGGNGLGGAACLMSGSLKMGNCTFAGNNATGGTGGQGGRSNYGFVQIVIGEGKPSMAGYYFGGTGGGGGEGMGGAVYVSEYSDSSSIENCTFSGNSVNGGAGGAPADGITNMVGLEDFSKSGPPSMGGSIGSSFRSDICSYASRGTGIRNLTGTGSDTIHGTSEISGPNAKESKVTSSTYSLTADGTATATIYVSLCDGGRLPIFGDPLVLEQKTGNSVISPASATTDIDGNATFTVKCATPGSETYIVKDTAYNMTIGQVTLDYLPSTAWKCTVTANPTKATANGSDSSTISVTLKDENGCIVRGKTVVLDQGSGKSIISPVSAITDSNGTARFTVTNTKIEKVTYTATDIIDNVTVVKTASVDFTIGSSDVGKSTVTADNKSAAANGTDSSNITVVLKDPTGHPVSGKTIALDQGTGHSRITPATAVTDNSGAVTFTVTDSYAEKVTYTAKNVTDNIVLTDNVSITYSQSDWIVNTLTDDGSLGTLRYAIDNAPPGTTITFDSELKGKILLSGQLPIINKNLTIDGTGASITISGNNCRVLQVDGGTVNLTNLIIEDGRAGGGDGYGGGLLVTNGTVSVNNVTFNNNGACGGGGGFGYYTNGGNGGNGFGGAVAVRGGSLAAANCQFTNNFANGGEGGAAQYGNGGNGGNGDGGGIYIGSGSVTINDCNFDNNSANANSGGTGTYGGSGGNGFGGAVSMRGGSLILDNSQFNRNSAKGGNGVLGSWGGNGGNGTGGAIFVESGSLNLTDSQFSGDSVALGNAGSGSRGNGAAGSAVCADLYNKNGMVSVNNVIFDSGDNIYNNPATADAGKSIITAGPNNKPADGTATVTIKVTLKDANGGQLGNGKTVTLKSSSNGSNIVPVNNGLTDSNGTATFTATETNTGAVTYTAIDTTDNVTLNQTAIVTFKSFDWMVTSSNDSGFGTLRYIVQNAPLGATITFDDGLSDPIILQSPLPAINKDLTIDGIGAKVTISGNSNRVFQVDGGTVTIKNLTLANSAAYGSGGSPTVNGGDAKGGSILIMGGTVSINNVIFNNNIALGGSGVWDQWQYAHGGGGYGGAVFLDAGSLTITDSQFTNCRATGGDGGLVQAPYARDRGGNGGNGYGGAIYINTGSLTITNSQFNGNSVGGGKGRGENGSGGSRYAMDIYNHSGVITQSNITMDPGNYYNEAPADAGHSTVAASLSEALSDGTATVSVIVTIKDINGSPLAGKAVTLGQGTGNSNISPSGDAITDISGRAIFTVSDIKAEKVSYTAFDATDNFTITQMATVTFLPPDTEQSAITASQTNATADGNDKLTITVTLKYSDGTPAADKKVMLSQGTSSSNISPSAGAITDNNGTATFTVTDAKAEQVTYTAVDSTDDIMVTQKVTVTFNTYDWVVTGLSDDNTPGTLRYAVQNAPIGTEIKFKTDLKGTITLKSPLPVINKDLTIDGSGASVTISGDNKYRVFEVDSGKVCIKDITVANGKAVGNDALKGSDNNNNYGGNGDNNIACGGGGLLVINGTVSLDGVIFKDNSAIGGSGGNGGYGLKGGDGGKGGDCKGGAIFLESGSLNITDNTFTGNNSIGGTGGDGGSGWYWTGGNGGNGGNSYGGAIFISSGSIVITNSTFNGNNVISGSYGKGGSGRDSYNGGSNGSPGSAVAVDLYNNEGTVIINNVTFDSGNNSYYNLPSGCIVTFDSQGGSQVAGISNNPNSKVKQPIAPTRMGYPFDGWYKEASCTNKWDFNTDTVSDNITLYAKWTVIKHDVSVSANTSTTGYVYGGGIYSYGDSVVVKADPISGYLFTNWTENGTEVSKNSNYTFAMGAVDRIIVANFRPMTYTIANINDQTLATLIEGYVSNTQKEKTITVTRTGSGELADLKTELGGTDADSFVITQPGKTTLNSTTQSATFTVKAKDGLAAGTYNATVTIKAKNMTSVTFNVTLTVRVGVSATLSTANANFDRNPVKQADVSTNITWNDAGSVTDIKAGGTSIGPGNYTVSGNTLVIILGYLASQATGDLELTVEFESGSASVLTIGITDTTPPAISPSVKSYDLNSPSDISTDISWSNAKSVTDIVYGSDVLTVNDFTITGNTLTIMNSYLASKNCSVGDKLKFDITFDTGDASSLTVNVVNNYIPSSDATLISLKVGGITVTGFDPGIDTYNVKLPCNTQYNSTAATIDATVNDSRSFVKITQITQLPGDATVIVTAEDKTTKTYTINFTLAANNLPSLKAGVTAAANASVSVNSAFTLDLSTIFKDTDNDPLTYLVSIDGIAPAPANQIFSYTPASAGSTVMEFKANDGTLGSNDTYTVTLTAVNQGGGGGSGTPVITPPAVTNNSKTTVSGNTVITEATTDNSGKAATTITQQQMNNAIDNSVSKAENQSQGIAATVEIKVEAPDNAAAVETSIPTEAVSKAVNNGIQAITVTTPVAAITFDDKALSTISKEASGTVKITASKVETSSISTEAQQVVGDRPVFNFSVTSGDRTISQFGGNVSVSVPYTPKSGEDTNALVIYYINAEGKPELVNNCVYDPSTGSITFNTNHFSQYAVGYNKVSFKDVSADVWYSKAVAFIAAREITTGSGYGNFGPNEKLTRGQFIVMLMKAYGIAPDMNPKDNFADAGSTWYTGYLSKAKLLGISAGVGNNMFAPENEITRQEMFTLLYNGLKVIGKLPSVDSGKLVESFSDASDIAPWAKDSIKLFVETGTISGGGNKLSPKDKTTRAQMAQVLYSLLSK